MSRTPSGQRRWKRYRPPAEPRTEDGARTGEPPRPPASRPAPAKRPARSERSRPKPPRPSREEVERRERRKGWRIGALTTVVVVGIVVAIAVGQDDDDSATSSSGLRSDTRSAAFVTRALATARSEEGEDPAISVRLSEYGLTVEYFDATTQKIRTIETDPSGDYTVRVRDNYYSDYLPRPFELSLVDPERTIAELERAISRSEDPYRFEVRYEVATESDKVVMDVEVSGDEEVRREIVVGDPVPPVTVPGASGGAAQ